MTAADLSRTPSGARATTFGVHCFERQFAGEEARPPVRLVVFDCDETLTLSTFMPKEKEFARRIGWSSWPDYISMMNFGSPFLEENMDFEKPFGEDSRLTKLQNLLQSLARGEDGQVRSLAVLTRNARGAVACLNLLMMAKLAQFFSVVWSMSTKSQMPNAVYRTGGTWKAFQAPLDTIFDHKADVLTTVASDPAKWFPQLAGAESADFAHLLDLRLESIVLVDDVRTNFQSPGPDGPKVLRYCKVARYDAKHPQLGFLADMGGIGARRSEDYGTLLSFVMEPWKFKEEPGVLCLERPFDGCEAYPPVRLVVFEFDETLSLCTFLSGEQPFTREIGQLGKEEERDYLRDYNFESPFVEGSRIARLRELLSELGTTESREPRALAILTENQAGAVAVLNLLLLAELANFFCAIWAPMAEEGMPRCVCKGPQGWTECSLHCPSVAGGESKSSILAKICQQPLEWFPQAFDEAGKARQGMEHLAPGTLRLENIVLIDDERTKVQTGAGDGTQVLRFCRVARYDDIYRDQGLLMHMGGIGARSEKDYRLLRYFVDKPWKSRIDADPECPKLQHPHDLLEHSLPEVELPKPLPFCVRGMPRASTAPPGHFRRMQDSMQSAHQSPSSLHMEDVQFKSETP